jgi:hypothetical protein
MKIKKITESKEDILKLYYTVEIYFSESINKRRKSYYLDPSEMRAVLIFSVSRKHQLHGVSNSTYCLLLNRDSVW